MIEQYMCLRIVQTRMIAVGMEAFHHMIYSNVKLLAKHKERLYSIYIALDNHREDISELKVSCISF